MAPTVSVAKPEAYVVSKIQNYPSQTSEINVFIHANQALFSVVYVTEA